MNRPSPVFGRFQMDVVALAGCRGALVSACDTVELSSNQK